MIQKPAFSIFSAERENLSKEENAARTQFAARQLTQAGISAVPVRGKYLGTAEHAFLVFDIDQSTVDTVDRLARIYDQETVLHVDGARRAYLEYLFDGRSQELGPFRLIDPAEAARLDSVTQTPDGQLYAAVA